MPQLSYVWEQRKDSQGIYSFCLNKKHILLNKLKTTLNSDQKNILNAYLNLIEKCSPMELSGINDTVGNNHGTLSESEYREIVYQAKMLMTVLIRNNNSKEEIRSLFQQLPDCSMLMDSFDSMYMEAYDESK